MRSALPPFLRAAGVIVAALSGAMGCQGDDSSDDGAAGAAGSAGASGGAGAAGASGSPSYAAAYTIDAFDNVRINSDSAKENFQKASTSIDLRDAPFESVTLVIDLDTTCFPFESWQGNPPPAGHNWPADCDAFDRNFEFILDEPVDADLDPPGIELVRAITPFGGPLHLEVDITDVANGSPGEHLLTTRITTWSDASGQVTGADGGWNVTTRIDVVPGPAPREVLAVRSLYNGSRTEPGIEPLAIEVPDGTVSTRLEYRVTGHGAATFAPGCGLSPAEEFCRRTHALFVDESLFADVDPWRDDCDQLCTLAHQGPANGGFDYCMENPTGAIESVRAPRSNWCPGSLTPPFVFDIDELRSPGDHTFRWQISDVADGGSWRSSTTFFAFGAGD